ncbi:MAG: hypothetical protein DRN27_05340 [Thermoplasmata archaeon]|nr:MAG: hypothetical protein DRN27_05340 [Thermoplasmata archaeon]
MTDYNETMSESLIQEVEANIKEFLQLDNVDTHILTENFFLWKTRSGSIWYLQHLMLGKASLLGRVIKNDRTAGIESSICLKKISDDNLALNQDMDANKFINTQFGSSFIKEAWIKERIIDSSFADYAILIDEETIESYIPVKKYNGCYDPKTHQIFSKNEVMANVILDVVGEDRTIEGLLPVKLIKTLGLSESEDE